MTDGRDSEWCCCAGMQAAIENAGERGLAVLVRGNTDTVPAYLCLQSRGVAFVDEGLMLGDRERPSSVNLSATTGVTYCPWCGRIVSELIDAHPAQYAALVERHKRLF